MYRPSTDGEPRAFSHPRHPVHRDLAANRPLSGEITSLREENARLKAEIESLESLQGDLLGIISHELRTPLTVIQGLTEILLDCGDRAPNPTEFLTQILKSCGQLGRLVEQSITLARLQAGQLKPSPDALGLRESVDRVVVRFADVIRDKAIIIVRKFPVDLPPVWIDGICLDAVLSALIENAVKFNKSAGRIYFTARADRRGVGLKIRNTGAGIPPENLAQIFKLFDQVETGHTRRYGGLGLGLPLVKRLLDLAGGEIAASSPGTGRGATFTLSLRRAPAGLRLG